MKIFEHELTRKQFVDVICNDNENIDNDFVEFLMDAAENPDAHMIDGKQLKMYLIKMFNSIKEVILERRGNFHDRGKDLKFIDYELKNGFPCLGHLCDGSIGNPEIVFNIDGKTPSKCIYKLSDFIETGRVSRSSLMNPRQCFDASHGIVGACKNHVGWFLRCFPIAEHVQMALECFNKYNHYKKIYKNQSNDTIIDRDSILIGWMERMENRNHIIVKITDQLNDLNDQAFEMERRINAIEKRKQITALKIVTFIGVLSIAAAILV